MALAGAISSVLISHNVKRLMEHMEHMQRELQRELNAHVESMATDLRILEAWYWNFADVPSDLLSDYVRHGLNLIREVFCDYKNLLDYIEVLAESSECATNPGHTSDISYLRSLQAYMYQITARAKDLTYKCQNARPCARYKEEEETELVGMDGPRDELIKRLKEEDVSMKQVSIVGIGGLGKTSLARVVYHQRKKQFDCSAFVTVPLEPGMEGFFTEMLHQLDMVNHLNVSKEAKDEGQLIPLIREFLQDKRYLVVVDDLRKKEDWLKISRSLPDNIHGSRVITTSRFSGIANLCSSGCDESIYQIPHLEYLDSRKLFLKGFFGSEMTCPNAPTDIFDGILKMCGGTPSEIISIASFLATEVTAIKPWLEMMNSIHSAWKQTATEHTNITGFADLRRILTLIYHQLPITLKDCLLYLAVDAKNKMIYRTTAVRKWIAEGFISEYGKFSPEEVASRYFDELISRNFIQLVEYGDYLGEEIYEVNYVVLYVLRLISQEINFATILSDVDISNAYAHAVRLSVQCSGTELSIETEKMDLSGIRSITIVGPAKFHITNDLLYLRVLDLDGCKDLNNYFMDHICRMFLLKYLSLKHTQVTEIPPDIMELRNLETLDASHTRISNLPPEIGEMQNLETLDIRQTEISNVPPEIGKLQRLKTLAASHTKISRLPPEIGKLQNLRTLDASHTRISNLPPEIGEMQNLETLDASHTRISNLPPEIGKLQELKTLDASHTQISCVPREIGKLQNMETLDVRQTHVKELPKEIVQLPKLAHLYFGQLSSPRGVKLPAGSDLLKSVEALGTVDSREWSASAMEEISGLTGLRELEVVLHDQPADKEHDHTLLSSIGKCKNLEYLIIYGDHNPSDDLPVSSYFPLLERLKVAGRFMKVPRWIAQLTTLRKLDARVCKLDQDDLKILGGLPVLSTLTLELICIPWKKEVAITNGLKSSTSTDLSPTEESSPAGFMSLEVFIFDCRVPWITFEQGAMRRLKQLHMKLYACPPDKFPSGLNNLDSLEKIIVHYPSVYASSSSVTKVVAAIREGASSHRNLIDLSVNGYHEVFLSNTMVNQTLAGSEIEEASNHGNPIELSVNAEHEVFLSNARIDETITSTGIEEASNHGNPIELSVHVDHDVLLSNTRVDETITGTEIKECY